MINNMKELVDFLSDMEEEGRKIEEEEAMISEEQKELEKNDWNI